ncbi:hypothetical protein ACN20G_23475 [Streptomyces sp. BI20]|uniref:hypothetical protein n=1 Tax=Streptomyces sp. BI20 TaxID=3403460 RepID=UPI003C70C1DB
MNSVAGSGFQDHSGDVFIPELYTAKYLQNLEENLVLGSSLFVNRDYEGEFRREGDVLHVPHFVDTVRDQGRVDAYEKIESPDHATLEYMDVRVGKGSSFNIEIDGVHQWQTKDGLSLMENLIQQRARRSAIAIDRLVAQTITAATYGRDYNGFHTDADLATEAKINALPPLHGQVEKLTVDQAEGFSVYRAVVEMIMTLDLNHAPEDRFLMISPQMRAAMLNDHNFMNAAGWGGTPVMPTGQIGSVLGVPVYVSNVLGNGVRKGEMAVSDPDPKKPLTLKGTGPNKRLVKDSHDQAQGIEMIMGATNAVSLLVPYAEMKQYEPELSFTSAIKSRVFYDAKLIRPEQLVVCPNLPAASTNPKTS